MSKNLTFCFASYLKTRLTKSRCDYYSDAKTVSEVIRDYLDRRMEFATSTVHDSAGRNNEAGRNSQRCSASQSLKVF